MPICGFVRKFEIVSHPEYSDCLRVSIWYSGSTPEVFSELLGETFPNVGISSERSRKKRFLVHGDVEHIVVNKNNRKLVKSLENLLKVFGRCITIEDGLDESHALSPHSPKNEDDEFYRSKVGTLVNQAKDYTRAPTISGQASDAAISRKGDEFYRQTSSLPSCKCNSLCSIFKSVNNTDATQYSGQSYS